MHPADCYINPLCCWWLLRSILNDAKIVKNDRNPGKWVLIREYSSRAFQWIPTWKGFDDFQENLHSYALDESSLSIGRVNSEVRGCRFKSAGSPLAGWHGRYTNVHLCGCLSIVLLQLKVPLKLFVKSREFLTDYMFLLHHNMTEADESNVKTNFLPPDILIFVLFGLHTIFILSKIWLKQGCRYYSLSLTFVFSSNIFNPSDAELNFIQCTKKQKIMKIILTLSCWYSLERSRWVLSDEYPFARVSVIFQVFCLILYWPN